MASRIQGITVEIGGDTTKLSKTNDTCYGMTYHEYVPAIRHFL